MGIGRKALVNPQTRPRPYVQKLRLTFTPPETGNYEVSFSCMVSHSDTGVFAQTRVPVDDTDTYKETLQELYNFKYSDGAYYGRHGIFVVNLDASVHTLDLDFATGDSGKTMYIKEAIITARRID